MMVKKEDSSQSHHSCSSGEGISPAVPFSGSPSFLACHQLWSSLLMICRMSPVLKGIPAWAQGMRSSSRGSYSNWALTKMSQGGGAERYEGTIWNIKSISVWSNSTMSMQRSDDSIVQWYLPDYQKIFYLIKIFKLKSEIFWFTHDSFFIVNGRKII